MADQLATPEDLASLVQQTDLDRGTVELLLENATAIVQNAAGGQRILQVVDDEQTIYLDTHDDPYWLLLPQFPATSVSSVVVGSTAITDWYPQYNRNRLFREVPWRSGAFGWEPLGVTVTYTHGYPDGDQRLQLARQAVLMLASQGFLNPTGATTEQVGDVVTTYAAMAARMEASPALMQALRRQYSRTGSSVRLINAWQGPRPGGIRA